MVRLALLILSALLTVHSAELDKKESTREEKLRSGLIDAFQNIKKVSAKGIDDETASNSDLIGSVSSDSSKIDKSSTDRSFDLFADDDGLSFADFSNIETETKHSSTEKSHNVQHIVKTPRQTDRTTSKPSKDILGKLTESIRDTVNESRLALKKEPANTTEFMALEHMLRIFDAEILVKQWNDLHSSVSGKCKQDLQDYVDGLLANKLWALKSKCFVLIYWKYCNMAT